MTKVPYVHPAHRVHQLQKDVAALRETVGTLITWMATSAGSPISTFEAAKLLKMLRETDPHD